MRSIAILLSGGTGLRLGGDIPKQYIEIKGRPIISYSIDTLIKSGRVEHIQVVCAPQYEELIERLADGKISIGFTKPGANRQLSILNALKDSEKIADDNATVFIHDAARPKLSLKMIDECFEALKEHDGVIPVLPMKDTVYECDKNGKISALLDRDKIFAGQAPELFSFKKYIEANRTCSLDTLLKIHGSTEPAIMAGMDIVTIPGDEENIKITTLSDLDKFKKEMELTVL